MVSERTPKIVPICFGASGAFEMRDSVCEHAFIMVVKYVVIRWGPNQKLNWLTWRLLDDLDRPRKRPMRWEISILAW